MMLTECFCGHLSDVHDDLCKPVVGRCLISGCHCKAFEEMR